MDKNQQGQATQSGDQGSSGGGMLGGMGDKLSSAVGEGQGSGDDQSYLSKGIDAVQQSVYGKGGQPGAGQEAQLGMSQEKQDIHSAVDQAHPEKISKFMRDKYMSRTEEEDREDGRG